MKKTNIHPGPVAQSDKINRILFDNNNYCAILLIDKQTKGNRPMKTFMIENDWDDRNLCATDWSWINDGRESANFKTLEEATTAMEYQVLHNPEDAGRLTVVEI